MARLQIGSDAARVAAGGMLAEHQRLPTSGARTALPFELEGALFLAVPSSAGCAGSRRTLNAGNSNVDTIIYRWQQGQFIEQERLPTPGAEDVLVFRIDGDTVLGTASIRSGTGPYEMNGGTPLPARRRAVGP